MTWVGRAALALAAVALAAAAVIWIAGGMAFTRRYDQVVGVAPPVSTDIALGERLSKIYGCNACHGATLGGGVFVESPLLGRIVAPNLTTVVARQTDADLERAIRRGVNEARRSVFVMPSSSFHQMRDEDLAAIIAYLRAAPRVEMKQPDTAPGILGRLGLLFGMFPAEAPLVAKLAPRRDFDFSDPLAHGEYLAIVACGECHSPDLGGTGSGEMATPDLIVASGYDLEEFTTLMRTGVPIGGRDLDLMDDVARYRFSHFTDGEAAAIHAFLVARAAAQ